MKRAAVFFSVLGLLSIGAAQAMPGMNHGAAHATQSEQKLSPMQQELMQGMDAMHRDMHEGMMLVDTDGAFAAGMIPHHQGAIAMAKAELKYGKDPEMRKLAQQIIDAQDPEILRMTKWLSANPEAAKTRAHSHADMSPMHKELMAGMTKMHDDMMKGSMMADPDVAFAAGMIPHHIGAVDMAKVELKYGKDADMKALAQEIIDAQQPEIEQMRAWLKRKGCGGQF